MIHNNHHFQKRKIVSDRSWTSINFSKAQHSQLLTDIRLLFCVIQSFSHCTFYQDKMIIQCRIWEFRNSCNACITSRRKEIARSRYRDLMAKTMIINLRNDKDAIRSSISNLRPCTSTEEATLCPVIIDGKTDVLREQFTISITNEQTWSLSSV